MMIAAGLTGSLGAGKTTVAKIFEDCGAVVIDTDQIARELLERKGAHQQKVRRIFPGAVAGAGIDRKALAGIVFQHPRKLKQLEDILHPAVRREILKRLKVLSEKRMLKMVVVDVPLLFEAGFEDIFDAVIVVKANQTLQVERLRRSRRMTRKEIMMRLDRQMPQVEKLKRADFIIDNRYTKARTRAQVRRIWDGLVSV